MSGHLFVCLGYRCSLFIRFFYWNCFGCVAFIFLIVLFIQVPTGSSSRRIVLLFIRDIHQKRALQKTKRINIDDVLSLNNSKHLLIELEIKDTIYTASRTASYLDLHIEIDSEGPLRTKRYYKRENFNFPIKLLFIFSNIPAAAVCGVYISQFVRYSRACGSDYAFLDREFLLTRKILNQGFLVVNLKSPLIKCYCRHHDLVNRCERSVSQITTDMFRLSYSHSGTIISNDLSPSLQLD